MPAAVDLKRSIPSYRARRDVLEIVDVPPRQYLMVDGQGDPNASEDFTAAIQALYPVAYTVKAMSRSELGRDHVVMPLEGLWWADDMAAFTTVRDKTRWRWTLMIMVPDWIEPATVDRALEQVRSRKDPDRLGDVRLKTLHEGRCVQALHVGPFDAEAALLERMHSSFIPEHGLRMSGRHHEIYLSDRRRTAPERLRTILRQPVAPVDDTGRSG